jgi:cytoskeletal protein RodZ
VSIGETLADARRQSGLTVTQVSQRTRIRESIVRAIEGGDFSSCGGDFYARGHIRSIAAAVGADPVPLIREYDAEHDPPGSISAAEVFQPATPIRIREPRRSFGLGRVLVVVILAAIGYGVYHLVSSDGSSHPRASSASTVRPAVTPAPKPTAQPTPTPSPTATHKTGKPEATIVLTANQDCWVGLTNSSGQQQYEGVIPAGQSMTWHEKHKVNLVIGNPPGIKLTVDGKTITPNTTQVVTLNVDPSSKNPVTSGGTPVTTTGGNPATTTGPSGTATGTAGG